MEKEEEEEETMDAAPEAGARAEDAPTASANTQMD